MPAGATLLLSVLAFAPTLGWAAAPQGRSSTSRPAELASISDEHLENRPIGSPRLATAGGTGGMRVSGSNWWGKSLLALGGVLALIAGGAWALKRFFPSVGGGQSGRTIEVLGRYHLAPKQSLCLVRVGQRVVLVGVTAGNMRALLEISDPEEVHGLLGKSGGEAFPKFLQDEVSAMSGPQDEDGTGDRPVRVRQAIEHLRSYARKKSKATR